MREGTTRKLGRAMNVSHTLVAKAWKRAGLKPHRFERYKAPDDPAFGQEAADVIGLCVSQPQHAGVFWVDEKTATLALDRLDPGLPLSPAAPSATDSSIPGMEPRRSTQP